MPEERLNYPKLKLRRLNWTKIVKFKAKQTIFNLLDQPLTIDHGLLIEYFELNEAPPKEAPKVVQRVEVISSKKAQNVGLFLATAKEVSFEQIRDAIIEMNDAVLTEDQLKGLEKVLPSDDEALQLKVFSEATPEELAMLRPVERFFLELLKVPRLHSRVRIFSFSRSFKIRLGEVLQGIEEASMAVHNIASNEKFAHFLRVLLNVGNFLNFGSYAGGAFGYNFDAIQKIADTKSQKDPNFTLMDYLAQLLVDSKSPIVDMADTIDLAPCSKEQMQFLQNEYKALASDMATLDEELAALEGLPIAPGSYEERVVLFHRHSTKAMDKLFGLVNDLNGRYQVLKDFLLVPADEDINMYTTDLCSKFRGAVVKYRDSLQKAMAPKQQAAVQRSLAMAAATTVLKKTSIQLGAGDGQ